MNIYNTLYILEYAKSPIFDIISRDIYWTLQCSKNKYFYYHRGFDLPAKMCKKYKYWLRHGCHYRLIGFVNVHCSHNYLSYLMPGSNNNVLYSGNFKK